MKKNLRIASAAAAALLAVAPVAASVVNTTATVVSAATATTDPKLNNEVVLDYGVDLAKETSLTSAQVTSILNQLGLDPSAYTVSPVVKSATYNKGTGTSADTATQTLSLNIVPKVAPTKADEVANPIANTGLKIVAVDAKDTPVENPFGADGKLNKDVTGWKVVKASDSSNVELTVNVTRKSQQGDPYFYDKKSNTQLNDGQTVEIKAALANGFDAAKIADLINANYGYKTSNSADATAYLATTESEVRSQLLSQGLKRLANGNFDYPANGFTIKLTATASNGKPVTLNVRINSDVNYNAPVFVVTTKNSDGTRADDTIYYNGDTIKNVPAASIKLNGTLDLSALSKQVVAYLQSAKGNDHDTTATEVEKDQQIVNSTKVSFDTQAVNTSAKGFYTVVATATNPAGLTSKVNIVVTVGSADSVVKYATADTTVYNINGNVVTATTDQIKKDAQVETFGSIVASDGVSYTRIGSKDSNKFVKTSDLSDKIVAPQETTTTKTIMHVAKIYDKDGKATSEKSLHAYDSVSVVSTPVTIMGAKYYKLAGKDQYVKVGNIDGTSRTLSHNSYVYKNTGKASTVKSGKKTVKKLLKKGASVTTYGSAFNINGHKMYRIGKNQYVKVANF